jgi:nicotinate-nucleotide adenylyltransferase
MGGDSFQNITKWKNYEYILKNHTIILYNRPGFAITERHDADIVEMKAPLLEISATEIRKLIQEKKSIRYLMPESVIEEIEKGGYYRK